MFWPVWQVPHTIAISIHNYYRLHLTRLHTTPRNINQELQVSARSLFNPSLILILCIQRSTSISLQIHKYNGPSIHKTEHSCKTVSFSYPASVILYLLVNAVTTMATLLLVTSSTGPLFSQHAS